MAREAIRKYFGIEVATPVLSARIKQITFFENGPNSTKAFVVVEARNSGPPSVVTNWELAVPDRFVARACDREFLRPGGGTESLSDAPLEQGGRRSGTLTFSLTGVPVEDARQLRSRMCLTFEGIDRRRLQASDDGK